MEELVSDRNVTALPVNEYVFRYDEAHVAACLARRQSMRAWKPLSMLVHIAVVVGFCLIIVFLGAAIFNGSAKRADRWFLGMAVVVLGFLMFGSRLDRWNLAKRMKRSPAYGAQVRVTLSAAGAAFQSPLGKADQSWQAFTRFKRFADGYLLLEEPFICHWWPDAALTGGSLADVKQLVEGKVKAS